jgi:hypothetical protein
MCSTAVLRFSGGLDIFLALDTNCWNLATLALSHTRDDNEEDEQWQQWSFLGDDLHVSWPLFLTELGTTNAGRYTGAIFLSCWAEGIKQSFFRNTLQMHILIYIRVSRLDLEIHDVNHQE